MTSLLIIFLITIIFSALFSFWIKKFALKFGIVDRPDGILKKHKKVTPLLGGVAIFLSFFLMLFFVREQLVAGDLEYSHWLGVFVGACFLMIGGFLDDKYNLTPSRQFIFPLLAVGAVILGGVEINKITSPLGGFVFLDQKFSFSYGEHHYSLISAGFVLVWLLGMMYTTKLLDGIDGLVTSIIAIGAFIILLFTMTTRYYQPDIGLASLILLASCLGFLFFNWHPAKVFLGEGGSLFLGYILGVLAIISGGKIAIALLVMGIPIMDVFLIIIRRLREGKNPFRFADRKHLHFRFLDLGISQEKIVIFYTILALIFGLSALFLQSLGKLLALGILVIIMFFVAITLNYLDSKS